MSGLVKTFQISGNSPAGAAQAVVGKPVGGLGEYSRFTVHAEIAGVAGGALDIYLQRKVAAGEWQDWIHFPQLASGAGGFKYAAADHTNGTTPIVVGETDEAGTTGAPALAANTVAPGHPGDMVRALAVAAGGAAAGAGTNVKITILAARAGW